MYEKSKIGRRFEMLYQKPIMEILRFETRDVICASIDDYHDGNNPGGDQSGVSGSWIPQTPIN